MQRRRGPSCRVPHLAVVLVVAGILGACTTRDGGAGDANGQQPAGSRAPVAQGTDVTSVVDKAVSATTTSPASPDPVLPLTGLTVVVDPGHNGANGTHLDEINRSVDAGGFQKACNTTGTAADGTAEAEVNWLLALELRRELEAAGASVELTRMDNEGWGPCIDERAATARRHGADLLISLHADGAAPTAHGFHVIYPGELPGYVDQHVAGRSEALAMALRDRLIASGSQPATYLAEGSGVHRRTDLGTLNLAGVPAVMIEAGNMHHQQDLADLRDSAWRAEVAAVVTRSVVDQFVEEEAGG